MARWWLVVAIALVTCIVWYMNVELVPSMGSFRLQNWLALSDRRDTSTHDIVSFSGMLVMNYFNGSETSQCNGKCSSLFQRQKEKHEKWYDLRSDPNKVKKFLVYGSHQPAVSMDFSHCHASKCEMIHNKTNWREADVIIITDEAYPLGNRPLNQLWMMLVHESPLHTNIVKELEGKVNFTVTYRLDSTIHSPYGEYVPLSMDYYSNRPYPLPSKNYAQGKSKLVAWFVSNCNAKSPRDEYARELSTYIDVDIYGQCGFKECLRSSEDECFELLRKDYKFYLSFENSLCKDYITEKFFKNALSNDVVPVVMGASFEEYKMVAPPHSFIHVDQFESPAKLADYLLYLNRNGTAYNEYFSWHGHGVIRNWIAQPQCDMCLLVHTAHLVSPSWYQMYLNGGMMVVLGENYVGVFKQL
ncbi:unnamed protein product [Heterobilharzia americana]|nr:unnamed protein product [Heterobilharzia americana]